MPTTTEQPVRGYAHCRHPRCSGSRQEQVDAIRVEDSYSYYERGGDIPGPESSVVRFRFANEEDIPCPNCRNYRELTDAPRPSYESLSGFDQDGLLDIEVNANGSRFDASKQAEIQAEASESLKAENAELREQMAEMRGMMTALMAGQKPAEEG